MKKHSKILLIVAESRSGSTWLQITLNSHPDIRMQGELFNPHLSRDNLWSSGQDVFVPGHGGKERECRLRSLKKELAQRQERYSGFKVIVPQVIRFVDLLEFLDVFSGASVIFLERNNSVKAEVSNYLARSTGKWQADREEPEAARTATVHPKELHRFLEWRHHSKNLLLSMLSAYDFRIKPVVYEKMFADIPEYLSSISEFLSVPSGYEYSTLGKVNPRPLSELIENYEENREYFSRLPQYRDFFKA